MMGLLSEIKMYFISPLGRALYVWTTALATSFLLLAIATAFEIHGLQLSACAALIISIFGMMMEVLGIPGPILPIRRM